MSLPNLEIIAGEVTEVQLTSEKIEKEPGARAFQEPAQVVINQMRVFLICADGKERDYDFEEAQIGVHRGHNAVIVRGKRSKMQRSVNLMFINLSNAEREEYDHGFHALYKAPTFGARWRGVLGAAIILVFGLILSRTIISPDRAFAYSFFFALFFAFMSYWVIWPALALYMKMDRDRRTVREREQIRREVAARLKEELPPLHAPD